MNIAFFTEGGYFGKISREDPNMRTDQAWICALNATHHCVFNLEGINQKYDMGIIIIPKEENREHLSNQNYPLIKKIKTFCNKAWVMQESTHWDWQDEPYESMVWYYNQLMESDGIFCHNNIDLNYFAGITNKPVKILPTLMIEDQIKVSDEKQDRVFIAGNWHTTYRGFDSWIIGNEFDLPMYGFKSGKFKRGEESNGVNYLPWMNWSKFMFELSKCRYGVQTYQASAGQFPLNCAYLGIPCIGYDDINTQQDLFPDLSVKRGDIQHARELANNLKHNKEFYNTVSTKSKTLYNKLYKENVFIKNFKI